MKPIQNGHILTKRKREESGIGGIIGLGIKSPIAKVTTAVAPICPSSVSSIQGLHFMQSLQPGQSLREIGFRHNFGHQQSQQSDGIQEARTYQGESVQAQKARLVQKPETDVDTPAIAQVDGVQGQKALQIQRNTGSQDPHASKSSQVEGYQCQQAQQIQKVNGSQGQQSRQEETPRRAKASCINCRKSKVKCSGAVPCDRCIRLRIQRSCELWHRGPGRPLIVGNPSLRSCQFYTDVFECVAMAHDTLMFPSSLRCCLDNYCRMLIIMSYKEQSLAAMHAGTRLAMRAEVQ